MNSFARARIVPRNGILTALALCREKIAAIYFVGGNPFGHRDTNVARDARSLREWIVRYIGAVAEGRAIPQ
ncbi:MAG: hypothetical protein IT577_16590 [Verrucomicrobiae bacterium]|nr:hypothetical protein [Verrucomicrobiae bacterium]